MSICIGLHSLRGHTPQNIREAILAMDSNVITAEATDVLLSCDPKSKLPNVLPTPEEIDAAKAFLATEHSVDVLDEASKFLVAVHDVPHLHDRLLLHKFRGCFKDSASVIQKQVSTMGDALLEVRNSKRLASILMLVLKTGNVLNEGTGRGAANGFRFGCLGQLSQMKQVDRGPSASPTDSPRGQEGEASQQVMRGASNLTLVDHLVQVIGDKKPEVLDLIQELQSVPDAVRIDLKDVHSSIQQLRADLRRIATSASIRRRHRTNSGTPTALDGSPMGRQTSGGRPSLTGELAHLL